MLISNLSESSLPITIYLRKDAFRHNLRAMCTTSIRWEQSLTKESIFWVQVQKVLVETLEEYYSKKPILYVTYETYYGYIQGDFQEYAIWLRDVYKYPNINLKKDKDDIDWLFWQYCNRGHVNGINTFVDKNIFKGTEKEFRNLFVESK